MTMRVGVKIGHGEGRETQILPGHVYEVQPLNGQAGKKYTGRRGRLIGYVPSWETYGEETEKSDLDFFFRWLDTGKVGKFDPSAMVLITDEVKR